MASMYRKDFEKAAAIILKMVESANEILDNGDYEYYKSLHNEAVDMACSWAILFEDNNDRFDREKFLNACGLPEIY